MSSRRILDASLRRLKPERYRTRLVAGVAAELPFLWAAQEPWPKLLLDTTVYIDTLQGHEPAEVDRALDLGDLWHVTVTEAELSMLSGLLDPSYAGTATAIAEVAEVIEQRPTHRILNPDREVWREAGILAGLLARLQGYGKDQRRQALNDALIFLTAAKHGCAVLTRNISDFDLLMQLDSRGKALFYERG